MSPSELEVQVLERECVVGAGLVKTGTAQSRNQFSNIVENQGVGKTDKHLPFPLHLHSNNYPPNFVALKHPTGLLSFSHHQIDVWQNVSISQCGHKAMLQRGIKWTNDECVLLQASRVYKKISLLTL